MSYNSGERSDTKTWGKPKKRKNSGSDSDPNSGSDKVV